jgi:hypothetical protein
VETESRSVTAWVLRKELGLSAKGYGRIFGVIEMFSQ